MKYTLAIAVVLAVVAAVCDSSAIKADSRANLIAGNIGYGDIRLYAGNFQYSAGPSNAVQVQDVIWRGNSTNRISAVFATEVGGSQNARASIISGGIGYNGVTVRFESARGRGFYYFLEIYGR